ncbi:MAG: hypothetical protein IJK62_06020, partial [Bacteroidales bacterium]|nr:hypothetical protein [Bacteroidales bacterium]
MKNTNEMNEFVNRNSLVEGQSKDNSQLLTLVLIVFCLFFGGTAYAQDHIVAEGTTTNNYVPVYGLYGDDFLRCQTIYTSTMLSNVGLTSGSTITKLEYYLSSNPGAQWTSTYRVLIGSTASTTLSAFDNATSLTTVYEGTFIIDMDNKKLTIPLDTYYSYTGGNLIVEVHTIAEGNYKSASFYGISSTSASWQGYNGTSVANISGSSRSFVPKTNFYTESCLGVKNLDVSYTSSSATITWD